MAACQRCPGSLPVPQGVRLRGTSAQHIPRRPSAEYLASPGLMLAGRRATPSARGTAVSGGVLHHFTPRCSLVCTPPRRSRPRVSRGARSWCAATRRRWRTSLGSGASVGGDEDTAPSAPGTDPLLGFISASIGYPGATLLSQDSRARYVQPRSPSPTCGPLTASPVGTNEPRFRPIVDTWRMPHLGGADLQPVHLGFTRGGLPPELACCRVRRRRYRWNATGAVSR
jgi:hypothetical protein